MLHATETNLTLKGKIIKICSLIIKNNSKKNPRKSAAHYRK